MAFGNLDGTVRVFLSAPIGKRCIRKKTCKEIEKGYILPFTWLNVVVLNASETRGKGT